jgi:hypothetical protein
VLIAESRQILERTNDEELRCWVIMAEGLVHYMGGRFERARACCVDAEARLRAHTVGRNWELNVARLFLLFTLRHLGEIDELRRLSDKYMREARRRGDLLTDTSVRRVRNVAWLALGRPGRALRELERAAWSPPEGRFDLQHWYELEALAELALYNDQAAEALDVYAERFDDLSRSLLIRIQIVRAVSRWLRGRLALAAAETSTHPTSHLAVARRNARLLSREDTAYAEVWSHLLHAGAAALEEDTSTARTQLDNAARAARAADMSVCVAAARYRLGELARGEESAQQIADAEALLRSKGVVATERHVQIIAPGFGAANAPPDRDGDESSPRTDD